MNNHRRSAGPCDNVTPASAARFFAAFSPSASASTAPFPPVAPTHAGCPRPRAPATAPKRP
jgi:hypothetical protein